MGSPDAGTQWSVEYVGEVGPGPAALLPHRPTDIGLPPAQVICAPQHTNHGSLTHEPLPHAP